ncbi:MAG: tRNA pseudouridine(13) synthase TruD [Wenzhouxiangella sp.]|nr:MAG: tRNA pseudouridine(13) synthase TruD [Wenzhouxiangella sp.]
MTPYAWGPPPARASIRTEPEDFRVIEDLGHKPDGDGEHLWLWVEKREQNTAFVATELARAAGVHPRQVSFAGLKDRNAVTAQYFSIHLPGRPDPDWASWSLEGIQILEASRSSRKIQRGRLNGNRFELVLRDLDGDLDALETRLATVRDHGVPNGFGEQRFGGNNIARARALFAGQMRRKPSKNKRGFYLSAARSLLFNQVLAERIGQGNWNRLLPGDVAMLDGSHSWFVADPTDPDQIKRCTELDIHPTGPLVGEGENPVTDQVAELEARITAAEPDLVQGLHKFRLQAQRRALRMRIKDLTWQYTPDHKQLHLNFNLGQGSYATSVLRELVEV